MTRLALSCAAALLAFALPGAPAAEARGPEDPALIGAGDPEVIRALAAEIGTATLTADPLGDPLVRGRIGRTNYSLYFFDCREKTNDACASIQFYAVWDVGAVKPDAAFVNVWNTEYRYCKLYLDDEQDPRLEMDVNLKYGMPAGNLRANFRLWRDCLNTFLGYMGKKLPLSPGAPSGSGGTTDL
ncbi:YbjN domain-containing protein [Neomegalonema sp.]|uniref:YbjN domain-containing protein n=1 Tax=Neomegalonema sp. TaxID=2039713 RepID=UPI002631F687|nr:YbjN domain-containing protein [Neomegalonema sp.]MDD2868450.1 YbjN domain-containing protein [Neomegalonema sp.]